MTISDTAGSAGEFEYLLDLAARRTPGRILAKATSLQVGGSRVDGFPQAVDAHYLAHAGNILPTLVPELVNARATVQAQAADIASLRAEVLGLEHQLEEAQADHLATKATLGEARRLIRRLQKKVEAKPPVKVKHEIQEVVRYSVSVVPAAWFGSDGQMYALAYVPDQLDDASLLLEHSVVSQANPGSC